MGTSIAHPASKEGLLASKPRTQKNSKSVFAGCAKVSQMVGVVYPEVENERR